MLKPFLTANWRYLAMLNFAVDPEILAPHVPAGTELDFHNDKPTPASSASCPITPNLGALYSDRSRPISARRKSDTDKF